MFLRKRNGFTLLETMVATAIGSIIMLALLKVMTMVGSTRDKTGSIYGNMQERVSLMTRLQRDMESANSIYEEKNIDDPLQRDLFIKVRRQTGQRVAIDTAVYVNNGKCKMGDKVRKCVAGNCTIEYKLMKCVERHIFYEGNPVDITYTDAVAKAKKKVRTYQNVMHLSWCLGKDEVTGTYTSECSGMLDMMPETAVDDIPPSRAMIEYIARKEKREGKVADSSLNKIQYVFDLKNIDETDPTQEEGIISID